jgi:glycosyltransferase involved in cell wall biosynthesis
MGMKGSVLLISGLPLRPGLPTSFERQLTLLTGFFRKMGWSATVLGPEPEAFREAFRRYEPLAAILLGYPDQFRCLLNDRDIRIPLYLWAQCSRPPDPSSFGPAWAVPLTMQTKELMSRAGVPRVLSVIPHGVDTELFRPLSPKEYERAKRSFGVKGRFVVGAVGANTSRKRFDLIMETFRIFASRRTDALFLLKTDRIVGTDGGDLNAPAARLGIEGRTIILPGDLTLKQMRSLYGAFDVFVNLSEWEGFCLPAAEAMACGVPVVTHRIQGPGELIPYGELIAEDSVPYEEGGSTLHQAIPETAAKLMEKAAEDDALRRRLGAEGRAEAVSKYDARIIVRQWEQLLASGT